MWHELHPLKASHTQKKTLLKPHSMPDALLSVDFLGTKLIPLAMIWRNAFLHLGRRGRGSSVGKPWRVGRAKGTPRGAHTRCLHCSFLAHLPQLPWTSLLQQRGCSAKLHLSNVNKNTWPPSTAFLAPHLPGPGSCMLA